MGSYFLFRGGDEMRKLMILFGLFLFVNFFTVQKVYGGTRCIVENGTLIIHAKSYNVDGRSGWVGCTIGGIRGFNMPARKFWGNKGEVYIRVGPYEKYAGESFQVAWWGDKISPSKCAAVRGRPCKWCAIYGYHLENQLDVEGGTVPYGLN